MKIAVITDDEKTISQHFGRAHLYMVFTIEDGKITKTETREKAGHQNFGGHEQEESHEHEHHGSDDQSAHKHGQMTDTIADCEALISGGMGMGAYQHLLNLKIQPWITDISEIETAVQAYMTGNLVNHPEKLH